MLVYMVFFVLASLMWFFNKLSDDTNARIVYPVMFINIPMQKVVVNDLPDNIYLSVHGRGWDILRYKIGKSPEPVVVNLGRLNHILARESTTEFNLATNELVKEIESQLPSDITLSMIQPDTIYFIFSNYSEKRVAVRPVIDLRFESQCKIDGVISVSPESVSVTGPDIMLDTLQAVYTKCITARKVRQDVRREVELAPINDISLPRRKIRVEIPVSQFTESTISVPITIVNEPDSLHLRPMPSEVEVSFWVSMNDYSLINKSDFSVVIDAGKALGQIGLQLPVEVVAAPQNVYNISIEPEIVNFVLE